MWIKKSKCAMICVFKECKSAQFICGLIAFAFEMLYYIFLNDFISKVVYIV